MHWKYLYILTLLALIGCSTHDEEDLIKEDYYVSFSNGISYEQDIHLSRTKVFNGIFIPQNETVGIYGFGSVWAGEKKVENVIVNNDWKKADILSDCENAPYISQGPTEQLTAKDNSQLKFPPKDNPALVFYGYYPYMENENIEIESSDKGPRIKLNINPDMSQTKDYLYTGSVPVVPEGRSTTVALPFKHALSCVSFHISTKDGKYTGDNCPIIQKITVKTFSNQSGYMYIKDGSLEQTNDENKTFSHDANFKIDVNATTTYTGVDFLFMPTYEKDDEKKGNAIDEIIVSVLEPDSNEPKDYSIYKCNSISTNAIALKKGAKVLVNIEYKVRITITNSVEDWGYDGKHDTEIEIN